MGIPWNAIGTFHVDWHGMLLCLAHGDQPMGNASMSSSWGSTNGQSMECHWGPIIGGFHGMALWLAHGDQPMAFHGMALGLLWGPPWNGSMGSSWGSANGLLSLAHGDTTPLPFHGMAL